MLKDQFAQTQISKTHEENGVFSELFPNLSGLPVRKWFGNALKRTFDIFVSLLALVFLSPFFIFIAIAIKRDTPGPVFYRGPRIGRGGKMFKILKFRTMYEAPESYAGPSVTAQDDNRITPLGRWLRDTKINEFPQFWNVLIGEMSLVGPRPEDPKLAKTWPQEVAKDIFSVRPGITSPASILYRNEESLLSVKDVLQKYLKDLTPDKMRLDQLYVRRRSFLLDLDVLFWTFMIVLPIIRSYNPPEEMLFVGPITRLIRRYLNWFTIDTLVTFAAISVVHFSWQFISPLDVSWETGLGYAIIISLAFGFFGVFLGTNKIQWAKASVSDLTRLLPAWTLASIFAVGLNNWLKIYPLVFILTALSLSLTGYVVVRYHNRMTLYILARLARYLHQTITLERVLIVGSGRTAENVTWVLNHPTYSNKFEIVGYVDADMFAKGLRIYGGSIMGDPTEIPQLVNLYDIGVIIIADNRISLENYRAITNLCKDSSTRLAVIPDVFGSINRLVETPPFYLQPISPDSISIGHSTKMADGHESPCHFCVGRYTRLEMEVQIEQLEK